MVSRAVRFLQAPVFVDEDQTRIARLLNTMLLTILASSSAFLLLLPILEPERSYRILLIAGVIPLVLVLRTLMQQGRVRVASYLLVFGMWTIMTISIWTSGGVYSSSASLYVIFILAAGLLLGGKYGILVALMSMVAGAIILWAGIYGIIEQRVMMSPATFWMAQSLMFAMAAVLLYLDADSLQKTLRRARDNEQTLVERNRELELYTGMVEQREATLAETEKRYRVVSELISDYAYAVELKPGHGLSLIWVTDAFSRISGYQPYELPTAEDWMKIVEPADLSIIQAWIEASQAGEEHTCDYRILAKDGSQRWLRNYSRPIEDGGTGGMLRLYGAVQDISAQKQAEDEQSRLLTEISRQREELRALNRRLAETQELERKRLVQELHDQVGQNLTAISLNLNIVKGQMAPDGESAASIRARLDDTITLVRETTVRIRDVMSDLRPPVLDDYGLIASLEWYAARVNERTGLIIDVSCDSSIPRLAAPVENALFRITQEAITNIVKHADATHATVRMAASEDQIRLNIGDNGRGLTNIGPDQQIERSGWGLLTMQQRAESIGGQFGIESRNGSGTLVTVEVPL